MLGERIREARKAIGMTQDELAAACDVSRSTINRYENGKLTPPIQGLNRLSDVLDVPVSSLLDTCLSEEENAATDIAATMSVKILNDQTLQRIARLLNAMNAEQLDKVASMLEILFNDLKDQHQCLGGAERKPLHD